MVAEAIVLSKTGGRYVIRVDEHTMEASLRGRLKQTQQPRVLVGDVVTIRSHGDGSVTIEDRRPRRSVLKRRTPGRSRGVRPVAANVDQVVVVGAADRPAWDPHLIDRFVAVAAANHLPVVVVVNKNDLVEDCSTIAAPYREAGYPVVLTSVPNRLGLSELGGYLEEQVSLFTGPTGVGKSSLLNALQPGLRLRTRPVSTRSQGGRHTTVAAEMHPFGTKGFVVDTPGLRDIGLWGLDPQEVEAAFPEIRRRAPGCRFDDCRHVREPGCAVASAAAEGVLPESRLASYRQLLEEATQAARPWSQGRPR